MRVALYCRISTDEDLQRYSLVNQEEVLRRLAASRGWEVAAIFRDRTSGSNASRPGLDALLDLLAEGGADAVAVTEQDRLSRLEEVPWAILKQTFRDTATKLYTLSGEYDFGNEDQEFTADILALIDRRRRKTVVRQMVRGRAAAAKRGEWLGKPPFGYRRNPETGHLQPIPEEAAVVRDIFELYTSGLLGTARIAELVKDRINTRSVSFSFVADLLKNPVYVGDLCARIGAEDIAVPGAHEAIVTRERWQAANRLMQARATDYKRAMLAGVSGLVTGMIYCECGELLSPSTGSKWTRAGYTTYHYYRHLRKHRHGCKAAHRMDRVDHAVRQALADLAACPEVARKILRRAGTPREVEAAKARIQDIEARLNRLRQAEERLLPLYLSGDWDRKQLDAQKRQIARDLAAQAKALAEAQLKLRLAQSEAVDLDLVADAFAVVADIGTLALPEQQAVLRGLASRVTVSKECAITLTAMIPVREQTFVDYRVQAG